MIALVRSPISPSRAAGSRQKSAPMSAKRAVAPDSRIAFSVATKVNGLVMTSSPGPIPSAWSAATSAVVPLLTATACSTSCAAAKLRSNSSTIGPWASRPERRTSRTSFSSSRPSETTVMGTTPVMTSSALAPVLRARPVGGRVGVAADHFAAAADPSPVTCGKAGRPPN